MNFLVVLSFIVIMLALVNDTIEYAPIIAASMVLMRWYDNTKSKKIPV